MMNRERGTLELEPSIHNFSVIFVSTAPNDTYRNSRHKSKNKHSFENRSLMEVCIVIPHWCTLLYTSILQVYEGSSFCEPILQPMSMELSSNAALSWREVDQLNQSINYLCTGLPDTLPILN